MNSHPIKETGSWWFPNLSSISDRIYHGELSWSKEDGARLEVFGLDVDSWKAISANQTSMQLVHGQLNKIPCITLDEALITNIDFPLASTGRATIKAPRMTRGTIPFTSRNSLLLNTLSCEMEHLGEWFHANAIKSTFEDGLAKAECLPSWSMEIAQFNDISLQITKWNQISTGPGKFSAETHSSIVVRSENSFSFETGRSILDLFRSFLVFATDLPIHFLRITGSVTDESTLLPDGKKRNNTFDFFESNKDQISASGRHFRIEKTLIPCQPFDRIVTAFGHFRKLYSEHRMPIDFFLSERFGSKSFINQTFSDIIHGLEGLHRGVRGGTYMDQESYDKIILPPLVAAIPEGLASDHAAALKNRIKFGNGYSLRRRLKELAASHRKYAENIIGSPDDFSNTAVEMRNELAHALGNKAPDRTSVMKYFVMLHRARVLFQLELLHQMGFDEEFLRASTARMSSAEFAIRSW